MNQDSQAYSSALERLDPYSVLRDVLRNLVVIVMGALAVAMIVNLSVRSRYESTYSTSATFVVSSKTASNSAYSNLAAASSAADTFSNILNSSLLQKKVCRDLGMDSFNATATANVISNTNLMTVRVTADTPKNAYRIIRSIMANMPELTQYASTDMVMEVLKEPPVPTGADVGLNVRDQSSKAFWIAFALFALLFAFLSIRKETVKSEKDLEAKLDAKSLGLLYHERQYRSLEALIKRQKGRPLVSELTSSFEFNERNKKIAAQVVSAAKKYQAKTLAVTSLLPGEGKTLVSANLALTLAKRGHKVLLIDGDLRQPGQRKLFPEAAAAIQNKLSDVLDGSVSLPEATVYDAKSGLYLLLNRRPNPGAVDAVSSDGMGLLLEQAREHFSYVIVDTPAMSTAADAEALCNLTDMSLLVVGYDRALAQDLNDTIDALRACRAHFIGCLLNDVRSLPGTRQTVGGYGGYGRYGNYGKYGKYGKYGNYGAYGGYGHYAKQSDTKADRPSSEESL